MEQSPKTTETDFDVAEWSGAMESAASEICSLGREMVETHRVVGGRAEEVLNNLKLAERLACR